VGTCMHLHHNHRAAYFLNFIQKQVYKYIARVDRLNIAAKGRECDANENAASSLLCDDPV